MKTFTLIALILTSLNGFAQDADYTCDLRRYRLDLMLTADKSTSMSLTDTYTHRVIAQGYAKAIEKVGEKSHYFFYPGNGEPMKLTFKTEDAINFPSIIHGRIETKAGGFLLYENMDCQKY